MATRGERLRAARRRKKLTQHELVAHIKGLSVRTLGRLEGDKITDSAALPLIEDFLGITLDEPGTPATLASPLAKFGHTELVMEMLRRLDQATTAGSLPAGIEQEDDSIPGPRLHKPSEGLRSDGKA